MAKCKCNITPLPQAPKCKDESIFQRIDHIKIYANGRQVACNKDGEEMYDCINLNENEIEKWQKEADQKK